LRDNHSLKKFEVVGYDYLEKIVKAHTPHTGRVYLPAEWVGRRVAVILIE